ncbi:MAG TPA: DUF1501 domain-containing protein [Pirellulales bacterium]
MSHPLCNRWDHTLSRRRFLAGAGTATVATGATFAGLLNPAAAEELKRQEKQVLFVWLDGGMSQFESWDPKPHTEFGGPFRAIPTSVPGVHVSELLRRTAKQMHHLAVTRSVRTVDNSHSAGVARIQRGDPKNRGVDYPFFGSAVAKLLGPCSSGLPPYMWVKPGNGGFIPGDGGFLGAKYGALALGDAKPPENLLTPGSLSAEDDDLRNELRRKLNSRYAARHRKENSEANSYVYDVARELSRQTALFDESKIPPRDVERYGSHDLGRHMLMGRRLLEAGVRFVKVNSYGWDSHGDNFNASRSLVGKFDQAFSALIEDLSQRGMLDHVLVVALSEFGRTPKINSHVGRDHWPECWSIASAGCGLKRGVVIGATNEKGSDVATEPYDIGHFFHTWFTALGVNTGQVQYDNQGQPLPIAHDDYRPIADMLA